MNRAGAVSLPEPVRAARIVIAHMQPWRPRRCQSTAGIWAATLLVTFLAATARSAEALPPGFVRLREFAPSIQQDIRYASPFNFTGRIVAGYERPDCILWERAAAALARAQSHLLKEGFELKVYDCYRPLRAVQAFVAWSRSPDGDTMRAIFFPGYDKSKLFDLGFIALRSNHSKGLAVDAGLLRAGEREIAPPAAGGRCDGPFEQRVRESSLDLGTAYDCFSPRSATASSNLTAMAGENRARLRGALEAEGFRNYSREWWHYDFIDPSAPAQAYDVPVR